MIESKSKIRASGVEVEGEYPNTAWPALRLGPDATICPLAQPNKAIGHRVSDRTMVGI